ncbi:MAG: hypothetical protein ACXVPN_12605 [Bacteroidia bacterium]
MVLLAAENNMYTLGGGEIFIIALVACVFALGIYTLVKFRKSKNN